MSGEDVRDSIIRALTRISLSYDVDILYAAESGSRAWGFASHDSDYDVRFIYSHPLKWYLSIDSHKKRDVIDDIRMEFPSNAKLDIAGWDLRKALLLFKNSNPALHEWLRSPVVYVDRFWLAGHLLKLSETAVAMKALRFHYRHMAFGNYAKYLTHDVVQHKKYLYVVRPLLAVRWIDERNSDVPPVNMLELLHGISLPSEIRLQVRDLIRRKLDGDELGVGPRNDNLSAWIGDEIERLSSAADDEFGEPLDPTEDLNSLFRETLEKTREID